MVETKHTFPDNTLRKLSLRNSLRTTTKTKTPMFLRMVLNINIMNINELSDVLLCFLWEKVVKLHTAQTHTTLLGDPRDWF